MSQGDRDLALALMSVVDRTQAMIQFEPDGTILQANENFLNTMGYTQEEVVGRHHSMFLDPEVVQGDDYRAFWRDLRAGKSFSRQFTRRAKDGRTVWIFATYGPHLDENGTVTKVIKIATDVTARRSGIETIAHALQALSDGDLACKVAPCGVEDIDRLGRMFNTAVTRLSGAIESAKDTAETVSATADEMGEASADLSRRTENQAATLEETATSIKEMSRRAEVAAAGAKEVERTAGTARGTAETGGTVVEQAVRAMSNIEDSASRISQIIGVIDDIAFQTNLLALNAGVEAARAGDAGRGFAVVASEIRLLAQRTAEAADEIKQLITDSSTHVETGVDLVHQTGAQLKKIIAAVTDIHGHINKITTGAFDQAAALAEIHGAVGKLDTVTQQNAAMVEQSTGLSQVLSADARALSQQMALFRTGAAPGTASHPAEEVWETDLNAVSRAS